MYVILVYDIELKDYIGNRVLRKVFKVCKEFLNHIQNSVFEGELSIGQLMKLKFELKDFIRADKDSVIFFTSSKEEWLEKEIVGLNKNAFSNFL
jgi:CRISPR-associated protein Cas2